MFLQPLIRCNSPTHYSRPGATPQKRLSITRYGAQVGKAEEHLYDSCGDCPKDRLVPIFVLAVVAGCVLSRYLSAILPLCSGPPLFLFLEEKLGYLLLVFPAGIMEWGESAAFATYVTSAPKFRIFCTSSFVTYVNTMAFYANCLLTSKGPATVQ